MIGRKKGSSALTGLELELMQVLWREGRSSVQQVQTSLAATNELAYTTVQTVLNTLERKGKVGRMLVGRAFEYEAKTSRETVLKQAVRELAERMFGGSSEDLVMSLVKTRQVDPARIADLSRRISLEEEDVVEGETVKAKKPAKQVAKQGRVR